MTKLLPVMNELAWLNKKMAAPLNSSGVEILPSILLLLHSCSRLGVSSKFFRTIGVRMCPGQSALTRIPSGPHSIARLRVSWATAALLLLYTEVMRLRFAICVVS